MSYQIYFINQNKKITVDGGKLSAACELAGFPLNLVCGGERHMWKMQGAYQRESG